MAASLASDPDWVARGISALAAAIAMGSLFIGTKTYRRAGARVQMASPGRVRRRFSMDQSHQGIWLYAVVRNTGLAPVQVEFARWQIDGGDELPLQMRLSQGRHRLPEQSPFNADGTNAKLPPVFPVTIPGQHAFHWLTDAPDWDETATGRDAYRMRLVVRLGTGKIVRSPWMIINKDVDWPAMKKLAWPRRLG